MNRRIRYYKNFFFNRNSAILIPALFLATLCWFLIALSQTYIGTLYFPVQYVNIPKDKVVVTPLPKKITLSVKASGWEIIANRFQNTQYPIIINIDALRNKLFLATNPNLAVFSEHLSPDVSVYNITPDTIYFVFDNIATNKIPVKLNSDITYEKQFGPGEKLTVEPDSVLLTGPQTIVNYKKLWNTEQVVLIDVDRTIKKKIKLLLPDNPSLSLSIKDVLITIPVEEYTERNMEIPIDVIVPNKDYKVVIYPKTVKVSFNVSMKEFHLVKAGQFEATVDLSKIDIFANQMAEVKITQKPTLASNVNITPKMVEFILYK